MKKLLQISVSGALAFAISFLLLNAYALEIFNFNASVRSFIVGHGGARQTFSPDGIPYSTTPRHDRRFVSPFYVVHYGLIHSEHCRAQVDDTPYHWLEDSTAAYWPQPPRSNIEMFRASSDWVMENIGHDARGNAHLFYDFDWPYRNYPGQKLTAPWWSGLTDGHAITLLLRASDCFADDRYRTAARELYRSTLTPVADGGSLLLMNGHPWIEEYVDPQANEEEMSRVFNGMAYAYFGVRGYEEAEKIEGIANDLHRSIIQNLQVFDKGYWSYYDAIGNSANIKYHNVNLAIIEDPRIHDHRFQNIIARWKIGRSFPVIFYVLLGPNSISKWHFVITYLIILLFILAFIFFLFRLGNWNFR